MTEQHGNLSINSENIFPIIKKWMYSDHDIFVRELVSNGCDAITKLRKLDIMGETELPDDYVEKIRVIYNAKAKTLKFEDTGLGMSAQEVEEYINQIAFSGASDFLEKYQGRDDADQIIGHFGLGFYSAFMVADEVHIDSLSYAEGAEAVHWECDGGTQFSMRTGDRETVGTTVTLFLNEDCLEFANAYRLREVIGKYCGFMPVPIFLINEEEAPAIEIMPDAQPQEEPADEADTDVEAQDDSETADETAPETEDASAGEEEEKPKTIEAINDIHPLWAKNPSECTDEEYKEFYRNVFHDYKEPLFWIHLNMDYPFRLKGILYFPKINLEYESAEGVIKLYNNQVFIADNIKEVIPEFLMLLKGVIDCPDLPLNVSRSALQNDGFVTKISDYITKKVADKLAGMCKTDKENYEKYWDDISPFIKYGCLKDTKFCDKMNDYILFKDINGEYQTLPELLAPAASEEEDQTTEETQDSENIEETIGEATSDAGAADDDTAEEPDESEEPEDTRSVVYYVTDEQQQAQYIRMFKDQGMNAVLLTHQIDTSFISQLEMRNENYRFTRIDSDLTDSLTDEGDAEALSTATETLSKLFGNIMGNDNLTVTVKNLKDTSIASVLTISEQSQRMADMMKMYQTYGDSSMFPLEEVLTLNAAHPLVRYILENGEGEYTETFCRQLYDLARIANQPLSAEEMTAFVARSNEIMLALAE